MTRSVMMLDEFRVMDETGETVNLTTTIRFYNAVQDQWELIGMDEGNGLKDFGTTHRAGAGGAPGADVRRNEPQSIHDANPVIRH